jgi:predicted ATPase
LFSMGAFTQAQNHFERGLACYHPTQQRLNAISTGREPAIFTRCALAWTLWYRGYPDQALTRIQEALALARERSASRSVELEYALSNAAIVHQLRAEASGTRAQAEAALTIAQEQGFAQRLAQAMILRGWALAKQGEGADGLSQMVQGLSTYRATGAEAWCHYWLILLAEAYGIATRYEDGLIALTEALALVAQNGECYYEAEAYRLKGDLLLAQSSDNRTETEACFHEAVAVARRQQAKSLELRAAMSLARLWQQQGKRAEARELLAPIYGWFTEGFDTADLQEAQALLEELS